MVHHGSKAAFPSFDLVVREKVDQKLSYWCSLLIDSVNPKSEDSVHWKPVGPFVDFIFPTTSISKKRGRCTIDDFSGHLQQEYKVEFFSDLGSEDGGNNLLGYYWFQREYCFLKKIILKIFFYS